MTLVFDSLWENQGKRNCSNVMMVSHVVMLLIYAQQQCDRTDANAAETAVLLATGEQRNHVLYAPNIVLPAFPRAGSFPSWPMVSNASAVDWWYWVWWRWAEALCLRVWLSGNTCWRRNVSEGLVTGLLWPQQGGRCLFTLSQECAADPDVFPGPWSISWLWSVLLWQYGGRGIGLDRWRWQTTCVPLWVKPFRSSRPQVSRLVKSASMVEALAYVWLKVDKDHSLNWFWRSAVLRGIDLYPVRWSGAVGNVW